MSKKQCNKCKEWKDLEDFGKNNKNKTDGRLAKCKDCVNEERRIKRGYKTYICEECGREFSSNKEDSICRYCKISNLHKGSNSPNWRGGSYNSGLVSIETFEKHSNKIPEIEYRESLEQENIVEVRCEYCNEFFIPKYTQFNNKVKFGTLLLCNDECKDNCPNFGHNRLIGMSINGKGRDNPCWKGGEYEVRYIDHKKDLEWTGEIKNDGNGYLKSKCSNCETWFYPTRTQVYIRRRNVEEGKGNFYCSNECRESCPVYRQKYYRKDNKPITDREVQNELKEMVLRQDGYACIKCGSKKNLICHHIEGLHWEPVESADIDLCITVCKDCHEEIHKQPGCKKNELGCNK